MIDEHQASDDFAHRGLLRGVDDTCVRCALCVKAQKVFVLR